MRIIGSSIAAVAASIGQVAEFVDGMDPGPKWIEAAGQAVLIADEPELAPVMQGLVIPVTQLERTFLSKYSAGSSYTAYFFEWFNNRYIFIGRSSSSGRFYSSPNLQDDPIQRASVTSFTPYQYSMGGGKLCVYQSSVTSLHQVTSDGISWASAPSTISSQSGLPSTTIFAAGYHQGFHIVAGTGGRIARSANGETGWTGFTLPSGQQINAIASSPELGRIVAACNSGVIARSDDGGATWSETNTGISEALSVVAWDGDNFTFIGPNGRYVRTADGINVDAVGVIAPGMSTPQDLIWIEEKGIHMLAASSRDYDGRSALMSFGKDLQGLKHHYLGSEKPSSWRKVNWANGKLLAASGGNAFAASAGITYDPATHFVVPDLKAELGYKKWIRARA